MESDSVLSDQKFKCLKGQLNRDLLKALKKLKLKRMTKTQSKTLPMLLAGRDCCISAPTGSGKTLAFLLPIMNSLLKLNFASKKDVGALILSPTREIATQTCDVLQSLLSNNENIALSHALVIGGTDKESQKQNLKQGANIVVATPGNDLF